MVFILIGIVSANLIGNIFAYKWVNILMALIIILFGLHIGGFLRFKFLEYEKRLHLQNVGSFLLGFSFAFGWTPCIGPIFGTIIAMAATNTAKPLLMIFLYSFGLATPFILMAISSVWSLKFIEKVKIYMGIIEKVSALLLIGIGIFLLFKNF